MNYLDQSELRAEIDAYQQSGQMSAELVGMLYRLADGVFRLLRYTIDRDDFGQDCVIRFIEIAPTLDVEQNCFAYLTSVFQSVAAFEVRTQVRRRKHTLSAALGYTVTIPKPEPRPRRKRPTPKRPEMVIRPEPIEVRPKTPRPAPSTARRVEYQGESYTVGELARRVGKDPANLRKQLERVGWDVEAALKIGPPGPGFRRFVTYQGKTYNVNELADVLGVKPKTVRMRLERAGWDADEAFSTPIRVRRAAAPYTPPTPTTSSRPTRSR